MSDGLHEIGDSAAWDQALQAFDFVPPGQTSAWSHSPQFRGHDMLRLVSPKPGAVAVQGILKRSMGVARLIVNDGPLLGKACDEETWLAFVEALKERIGKTSLVSFASMQPYDPVHEVWLRRAGFQRPWSSNASPLTLYVNCAKKAALDADFSQDWRKNIRKGKKKGLVFEAVGLADAQARADFLRLYFETFSIKGIDANIDTPMLEGLGADPRWFAFFSAEAGKRLSARLVFVSGAYAFDFAAGTSAEGRKLSSSHFLAACVLRHLGDAGVAEFDFGRVGPGRYDSIDHFKYGSGGRPVSYLGEWSSSSRPWLELAIAAAGFLKRSERW